MELACCLFFFSFKGKACCLCLYETHMHLHIHMHMCIYVYMHIYIKTMRKERMRNKIICQVTGKKKKKAKYFQHFPLLFSLFITLHSERKPDILKYHNFKKFPKGKLWVLFVRFSSFV